MSIPDGQQVTLRGPGELQWRALARDGADYGPELATRYPTPNEGPGLLSVLAGGARDHDG